MKEDQLTSREKTMLEIVKKWVLHCEMQSKRFQKMGDKDSAYEWLIRMLQADKILTEICDELRLED